MKKYTAYIGALAALLVTGAAVTACSDKDDFINDAQQPQPDAATGIYTMTVKASKGNDGTRALALDGKTLKVKWYGTDHVSVLKAGTTTLLGTLTAAASETGTTTLSGDLTGTVNVGDKLHLIFPRADWEYTDQSGVLLGEGNSIEKNYDYAITDVTVASIDDSHITTTAEANLASQQAIVKFILKDKATDNPINAKKLTISAASNKLVTNKRLSDNNYYSGYTVDGGGGGISGDDHTHLVDGDPNTKWCDDYTRLWYIEFHTDAPVKVDGYMFRTAGDTKTYPGRNPRSWELQGKVKEDDEWTTIDSRSDNTDIPALNNTEHDFTASAPGTYQYFCLTIQNVQSGNIMQLSEMKLFAKGAETKEITEYGPISATPDAAASELTVALRNENTGADTYTLTAYDGSLYTLEKAGVTFENGKYHEITAKLTELTTIDLSTVTESEITVRNGNTITGTHDQELKIFIADGANVTLDNVNITNGSIVCNGNAGINLVGTNTITAPANYAAVQIGNESTTLTISGTGSLDAVGGSDGGAGIGTGLAQDEEKTGGNITINGGTINATGGSFGAGIGCGEAYSKTENNNAANKCGNITINGGTVTATGGLTAAGIGTGTAFINYEDRFASTVCGDISITGGTVTANGDVSAAGIGTGAVTTIMGTGSAKCGAITIGNGVTEVTATKVSDSACSIGKGGNTTYYECGTITIGGTTYPNGITDSPYTYQP